MATSTVENYLKCLYGMQQRSDGGLIPVGRLAEALGVAPGTATSMVQRLAERDAVQYTARKGVLLTPDGERQALQVLRRHRLVELFLVEVMEMDWAEVHDDAEVLEHAISDKLLERMDAMLGYPTHDPHGDPIPDSEGNIRQRALATLDAHGPGTTEVARIDDRDPAFMQFVSDHGLEPGATIHIAASDPVAGTVTVQPDGRDAMHLGTVVAQKIRVLAG